MNSALNAVTMTTMEIAVMTGKTHAHVLRDADRILTQLGESTSGLSSGATENTYTTSQNKVMRVLVLNKHMVFTIITGYDSGLRYTVLGRWIELEQAANPAFASQAITDTLNDLQSRVDMMAPAYTEHTRKGTTVGYTWREACRLAGVESPDKVLDMFRAKGLARTAKDLTELHPKYADRGHVKIVSRSNKAIKLTGHLFKVTLKGVDEWLRPSAEKIAKALADHRTITVVKDSDGYVLDITGEGSKSMTIQDLPKEAP